MKTYLEDVFVTEGVPEFTFVKPPNYNEILLDVRRPGKPVIIEGQSGTGKTTTARKILEQLDQGDAIKYLTARKGDDLLSIKGLTDDKTKGVYIIDDFHRLPNDLQVKLADIAKLAAEEGSETGLPKLIIIGINQVGNSLIQLVPDIAKRCGIHRIDPGDAATISRLIENGCSQLNVDIIDKENIFRESKGDYWLTQNLCQTICSMCDVTESQEVKKALNYSLDELRKRAIEKLSSTYNQPVKEFCRGKRFRNTNDPYYKLLRVVGEQDSSIVDLNRIAATSDWARGSINNIKEKRLSILLDSKEHLNRYFYYNNENKFFAIEDPALFYYLKHLDWQILRDDCGFKDDGNINFEFDIAISFAGENRELARTIASKLEIFDMSVFFDEYYEANFLGKALSKEFARIFSKENSRFVIGLLDTHHKQKIWPTFERDIFTPRVEEETVIPIYLDDSVFVGIPRDIYGIELKDKPIDSDRIDDAVIKIVERISG